MRGENFNNSEANNQSDTNPWDQIAQEADAFNPDQAKQNVAQAEQEIAQAQKAQESEKPTFEFIDTDDAEKARVMTEAAAPFMEKAAKGRDLIKFALTEEPKVKDPSYYFQPSIDKSISDLKKELKADQEHDKKLDEARQFYRGSYYRKATKGEIFNDYNYPEENRKKGVRVTMDGMAHISRPTGEEMVKKYIESAKKAAEKAGKEYDAKKAQLDRIDNMVGGNN